MKLLYIRPYDGEEAIVNTALPGVECIVAEAIDEVAPEVLAEVEVLSVFVDYQVGIAVLDKLPKLALIATRSAGYDHIAIEEALKRNIIVSRVPHYGSRTVAEYAIALMFALSRNAFRSYTDVQKDAGVEELEVYQGFDLTGKLLGVIGTGAIGRSVCDIAGGIGMRVVAFDIHPDEAFAAEHGFSYVSLDEVLQQADIVSIHVPSIPQTHHLLNEEKFALMKPGAYFINTARGELVDTKALVNSLKSGHLAGAGLDVLEGEHALREEAELLVGGSVDSALWETLVANHALIDMPNVIVTPHIAFNTVEAKREITDITIANITKFIAGEPQNTIIV